MLSVYLIFLLLLLALYSCFLLLKKKNKEGAEISLDEISIVIPFRNEAQNLPILLASLEKQKNYLKEIMCVNDHSEDDFAACFEDLKLDFTLIDSVGEGKKAALKQGISRATGNYILSLDADVELPNGYVEALGKIPEADLYIFPVKMRSHSFSGIFATLDFYFLAALNVSLAGVGKPIVANGANLLFRKSLYLEMLEQGQSQHISSGDDQFLLREAKSKKKEIRLLTDDSLTVETAAPDNFREFLHQRLRWIGKTRHVKDHTANLLALLGLVYHVSAFLIIGFYPHLYWIFALKCFCDLFVLLPQLLRMKQAVLLFFIPLFTLFYPVYMLILAAGSVLVTPEWKKRKIKH